MYYFRLRSAAEAEMLDQYAALLKKMRKRSDAAKTAAAPATPSSKKSR
jgi:hypothetical protein